MCLEKISIDELAQRDDVTVKNNKTLLSTPASAISGPLSGRTVPSNHFTVE